MNKNKVIQENKEELANEELPYTGDQLIIAKKYLSIKPRTERERWFQESIKRGGVVFENAATMIEGIYEGYEDNLKRLKRVIIGEGAVIVILSLELLLQLLR